jgi:hypothetical protein
VNSAQKPECDKDFLERQGFEQFGKALGSNLEQLANESTDPGIRQSWASTEIRW